MAINEEDEQYDDLGVGVRDDEADDDVSAPVGGGGGGDVEPRGVKLPPEILGTIQLHILSCKEEVCKARKRCTGAVDQKVQTHDISLIRFTDPVTNDENIFFIRWDNCYTHQARRIRLDPKGDITFNVAHRVQQDTFLPANTQILIPRVGQEMTKSFRSSMPRWCMLVRDACQVELFAGPHAPSETACCVVCEHLDKAGVQHGVPDPDLYKCWRCLSYFHQGCAYASASQPTLRFEPPFTCGVCSGAALPDPGGHTCSVAPLP